MREKDLKNIIEFLREMGPTSLYRGDLGRYAVVYHVDANPVDEEMNIIAMGVLAAVDSVCLVLQPLNQNNNYEPMPTTVRIPWHKVGFLWTQSLDAALDLLRAGESPSFMN